MNNLIVLLGPTSTGKTSLAIKLCKKFSGEIVSADSRQVYRFMDVGTGKIPISRKGHNIKKGLERWVVDGVNIWLYDVISPAQKFSVHDYAKKAARGIENIWKRGKIPFLVGGTGFYIDVVLGKQKVAEVEPDLKLREELEMLPTDELFEKLQGLDAKRAESIDRNNKVRLIRAIEVAVISEQKSENGKQNKNQLSDLGSLIFDSPLIGLTAPRKKLFERADEWVMEVISGGLIPEVKDLIKRGYKNTPAMKGLIYKTVVEYLEEKVEYSEMVKRIKFDLHGYIRRQMTWFGRNSQTVWFDITKIGFDKEIETCVESYLYG